MREINPAWIPPRPARDAARRPLRDNGSGVDFLYLHRRMIALVNGILSRANDPAYLRVEGWRRVPPPGDAEYPIPEFPDSGLEEVKSAEHFHRFIARWEQCFNDARYLSGVTLGQFGSDIEFTICNDMHLRWAASSPVGYRPSTAPEPEVDARWDAPTYDYLGDIYSSHVNPIFWKIHGWVDDRVEDWKRARGVSGEIDWRGRWVGPAPRVDVEAVDVTDELRRIDRVISASASAAGFDGFIRPTQSHPRDGLQPPRRPRV